MQLTDPTPIEVQACLGGTQPCETPIPPQDPRCPHPVRTRQSECLGPVQPAAHCSWQQSVGFVPLQRGQPWQMLLVTVGAQRDTLGTGTPVDPPPSGNGGVPRMRGWRVGRLPGQKSGWWEFRC